MRSVLIVDDNEAFAENLAEIIRDTGDEVTVVGSGAEAIEQVRGKHYDALLSDMRMPHMGGAEVVHQVRRIDPGLPAVVITAYSHDDEILAAVHEGLLAVLPKPVPVPRLLELIGCARRDGLVALIEDDVRLSENLSEALSGRGYTAVTAGTVTETQRFGELRPFAALVDLRVPGGPDGEAMRCLADHFPGLPMVVISAHAATAQPLPPHHELFTKPFSTELVLATIDRLYEARPRA